MTITAFKGPIVTYGAQPSADNEPFEGPDVHNMADMLMDPRGYTSYAGGNWVAGWFSGMRLVTVDAVPATINATCIAATQSAATAMVLASANNSSSQVVVGASFVNVNLGAIVS